MTTWRGALPLLALVLVGTAATKWTATTLTENRPQHPPLSDDQRSGKERHAERPFVLNQYFGGNESKATSNHPTGHETIDSTAYVITAVATVALVILGCVVARFQYRLMRDTMGATQKAADAATESNTRLERPWILFSTKPPEGWNNEPTNFPLTLRIQSKLANYGRSPAWGRAAIRLAFVSLPQPHDMVEVHSEWVPQHPVPPGDWREADWPVEIDAQRHASMLQQQSTIALQAHAMYVDVFEKPHTTRVCLLYNILAERPYSTPTVESFVWIPCGLPGHNQRD